MHVPRSPAFAGSLHLGRTALIATLISVGTAYADDAQTDVRAELTLAGDPVRLVMISGGKKSVTQVEVGKAKPVTLFEGEAVATVKTGHGKTIIALAGDHAKTPFRIHVLDKAGPSKATTIARPGKRHDYPFAVVMTATPTGFMILFQEVETANQNEAHTYMVELDKDGKLSGDAREVQIPWALGDAVWNGKGYHLALFYSGDMTGTRLSMVSMDTKGTPEQHPDWASQPGMVSDVHLVATAGKIRAYYRGGMGDRLLETDVTKIGQWGSTVAKAKDHGALAASASIAITPKGLPTKIKAAGK